MRHAYLVGILILAWKWLTGSESLPSIVHFEANIRTLESLRGTSPVLSADNPASARAGQFYSATCYASSMSSTSECKLHVPIDIASEMPGDKASTRQPRPNR